MNASIRTQEDACHRRARELGAEVAETYVDLGASGRTLSRPLLKQMIGRIEQRRDIDYVIVERPARLTRSLRANITLRTRLSQAGCQLMSAAVFPTPEDRLVSEITEAVLDWAAEHPLQEEAKG